jgi:hypothetical protein
MTTVEIVLVVNPFRLFVKRRPLDKVIKEPLVKLESGYEALKRWKSNALERQRQELSASATRQINSLLDCDWAA